MEQRVFQTKMEIRTNDDGRKPAILRPGKEEGETKDEEMKEEEVKKEDRYGSMMGYQSSSSSRCMSLRCEFEKTSRIYPDL